MKSYNQYELVEFLKDKHKFMNAKEIASQTNGTITTVSRKLKKMIGKKVEYKVKKEKVGNANRKIAVRYYRYKR